MAASRKLYVQLAKTLNYYVRNNDSPLLEQVIRDISMDLKQDNMAFDRDRFLTACGIESQGVRGSGWPS